MANTLTGLIPTIYKSLDTILAEPAGFIPAVTRDSSGEQVAIGQSIAWPVVPAASAGNVSPATTGPTPTDQTIPPSSMTITKSRSVVFGWNGEEQKSLDGLYNQILVDQFAQAMRTLRNEVDADLAGLYVAASRAYGTAGTAPFGTSDKITSLANIYKILADNGGPLGDLQLVINTLAGLNIRTLIELWQVNTSGSSEPLRRGVLLDLLGFTISESANVKTHTKGTGASYVTNGATNPGVTDIALITGTGTVLAGDVVTFAADANNKYVVATGIAAPGTISLAKPGARVTIPTSNAMTIGNNYTANLAFSKSAIALMTRVPAMPEGGDAADDVTVVTDPISGLSFQVALYRQYRQVAFEIGLAWGVKAIKAESIAILIG